jgi:hypothetical protein
MRFLLGGVYRRRAKIEAMLDARRFPAAKTLLFAVVIAAILAGFLLQMARGVCPVP